VVATQLWIPFTALFAWKMLGETMKPPAVAGLVVAFVGVAWMSLDPHGAADLPAIVLGVVASACWALATVFVRQTPGAKPLQVQALTAVVAAPVLLVMSFGFEDNVVERVQDSRADRLGLRGLRRAWSRPSGPAPCCSGWSSGARRGG
jgi:O-acetylserine/cysteine efflux transporter